jgi:hypothetical protein
VRSDVKNVIAERPKSGRTWQSKTPRKKLVALDPRGEPFDERYHPIRTEHQKHRARRFNVLERFLLHRVGRPWTKVYAEVCEIADRRSFSGAEIRAFVKRDVATGCWMEGRRVMGCDWSGCPEEVRGLYVHPKSGLLARNDIMLR